MVWESVANSPAGKGHPVNNEPFESATIKSVFVVGTFNRIRKQPSLIVPAWVL